MIRAYPNLCFRRILFLLLFLLSGLGVESMHANCQPNADPLQIDFDGTCREIDPFTLQPHFTEPTEVTVAKQTTSGNSAAAVNVLFLLADDQRWDTIGAYGNERIKTPNLDRLAGESINFYNAYCFGSPHGAVCIPSRAMMHSGQNLFRLNNLNLDGHRTLGELLQAGGYRTFGTGKWHNGSASFIRSFDIGKNVMLGGMSNHAEVPLVQLNAGADTFSDTTTGSHFSSKLFADAAIDFLSQHDGVQPFFCYVAFTAPHDPRMSPGNFNRMYRPEEMEVPRNFMPQHPFDNGDLMVRDEKLAGWPRTEEVIRSQTAEYYGLISHLDQQIGRILETLQTSGYADNTIVIYASDHGLAMGSHGLLGKQNLYEHSTKAPLMIRGDGIKPGQSDALVYLHDLFPTILELAEQPIPLANEGQSLVMFFDDDQAPGHDRQVIARDYLFTSYKDSIRAIRDGRWKLIRYPQVDRTQLFDLQNDPDEMNNLAASDDPNHRQLVADLLQQLELEQQRYGDVQPLYVDNPAPAEIDLTGRPRQPDRWQPKWIIDKYFESDNDE